MNIGIAGAGIMGRLLALAFVNAGWRVTLFDQGKKNCSMAAAGLLTPATEMDKNEPIIFQLGSAAITQHWPNILSQLPDNIYFQQKGSIVLAHPRDNAELMQFVRTIASKLNNGNVFQSLDQEKIKTLEPQIEKFSHGYHFPSEGQIDSQALLLALEKYLISKKVIWFNHDIIQDIQPGEIIYQNSVKKFDWVVDCRGLGSTIFKDLRAIRGEIVWLHAPDIFITRPIRFLHPRYSLYIVPRPNQTYLIGASEIESHDMTPISVRTLLELLTACCCVHPGFTEARVINTITHCRPVLDNHLPKIKYTQGIMAINGLYRHGFLIAPTLANEVVGWIQKGMSSVNYPELWEAL